MEELPVPDWKAREDGIFTLIEDSGALKQCVDEMVSDLAQDQVLITQLAHKLLERHDAIQMLAESAQIEEHEPMSPSSGKSGEQRLMLEWTGDVAQMLEGMMEEEVQQLIAERVWFKLDPELRQKPSIFLMRCVREAARAFYVGRAADPLLQGIPPVMIHSGGMKEMIEENEMESSSVQDHQTGTGLDLPPGFLHKGRMELKIEGQEAEEKLDPGNAISTKGVSHTAAQLNK